MALLPAKERGNAPCPVRMIQPHSVPSRLHMSSRAPHGQLAPKIQHAGAVSWLTPAVRVLILLMFPVPSLSQYLVGPPLLHQPLSKSLWATTILASPMELDGAAQALQDSNRSPTTPFRNLLAAPPITSSVPPSPGLITQAPRTSTTHAGRTISFYFIIIPLASIFCGGVLAVWVTACHRRGFRNRVINPPVKWDVPPLRSIAVVLSPRHSSPVYEQPMFPAVVSNYPSMDASGGSSIGSAGIGQWTTGPWSRNFLEVARGGPFAGVKLGDSLGSKVSSVREDEENMEGGLGCELVKAGGKVGEPAGLEPASSNTGLHVGDTLHGNTAQQVYCAGPTSKLWSLPSSGEGAGDVSKLVGFLPLKLQHRISRSWDKLPDYEEMVQKEASGADMLHTQALVNLSDRRASSSPVIRASDVALKHCYPNGPAGPPLYQSPFVGRKVAGGGVATGLSLSHSGGIQTGSALFLMSPEGASYALPPIRMRSALPVMLGASPPSDSHYISKTQRWGRMVTPPGHVVCEGIRVVSGDPGLPPPFPKSGGTDGGFSGGMTFLSGGVVRSQTKYLGEAFELEGNRRAGGGEAMFEHYRSQSQSSAGGYGRSDLYSMQGEPPESEREMDEVWGDATGGGESCTMSPPREARGRSGGVEMEVVAWGRWYPYEELKVATGGFHPGTVLGEGGYGKVYRGRMRDGEVVAVKKLINSRGQAAREFKSEVEAISRVQHTNLVKLKGYCTEAEHRLLVYEFVPNGNLHFHLHSREGKRKPLSWQLRMSIAIGAARGLHYLHGLDPRIIHRDVKSSNVLLDSAFVAKVSDFGLAKVLGRDTSHVTTRVMGTMGYVAPEYAQTGCLTEKSDVYSFGVLLLELVTGRRPFDNKRGPNEKHIVEWVIKAITSGRPVTAVVDPLLKGRFPAQGFARTLQLALKCADPNPLLRPRMGDVLRVLERHAMADRPGALGSDKVKNFFGMARRQGDNKDVGAVTAKESYGVFNLWGWNRS